MVLPFREEHDEEEDDRSWNQLKSDRCTPLYLTAGVEEPKTNPLAASDTRGLETTFNHDPSTSRLWFSAFRLPCGYGSNLETQADARHQASDDHLRDMPC